MHWGRALAPLTVAALIAAFLPLLGAAPAAAAPERRVYEKKVTLTSSIAGYPVAGAPAEQQLKRADVVLRYYDDGSAAIDADVWVKAPAGWHDAQIYVGIGQLVNGNDCRVNNNAGHYAISRITDDDDESRYWAWNSSMPASTSFNCAVVLVQEYSGDPSSAGVFDVMIGRLTDTYIQPKLTISRPQLLDKAKKQLKLVRGAAQKHSVVVKNTGKYRARNVVVVANGKGVKKVRRKAGVIEPGDSVTVTIPVRLTSKAKRTKVRFKVSGSGVAAARTVKVRAVKAPAKPAAGAWRSTNNSFTFTVKKGKITKFRGINLRMSCGGGVYGYATYRNVTLAFPNVKVPKHGYIDAAKKWRKGSAWYTATLRGRVVGKKMTQARFSYSTAGNCYVVETFTARKR